MTKPNTKSLLKALQDNDFKAGEMVEKISLSKIQAGKYQPRTTFEEESIRELAEGIRQQGLIQPIIVRELAENRYEIVAGERRFRAAKLLNLETIDAVVRKLDDKQTLAMALAENIDREDMTLVDEVEGIARLVAMDGARGASERVATLLGKSSKWVSYRVGIADGAMELQVFMRKGYSKDAAGFYELSKLYEENRTYAETLMTEWDQNPERRSGLRSQVLALREKAKSLQVRPVEKEVQEDNANLAVEEQDNAQQENEARETAVEIIRQSVPKKKTEHKTPNKVQITTFDVRQPPIHVGAIRKEGDAILLVTDEGLIPLEMETAVRTMLQEALMDE